MGARGARGARSGYKGVRFMPGCGRERDGIGGEIWVSALRHGVVDVDDVRLSLSICASRDCRKEH